MNEILGTQREAQGVTEESILTKPHPSFSQNTKLFSRLKFEIRLHPDCSKHLLKCIKRNFSLDEGTNGNRTFCKVVYDETAESTCAKQLSGKKHKLDNVDEITVEENKDDEIALSSRMSEPEARERILRTLPNTKQCENTPEREQNNHYLRDLIGTVLQSYNVNLNGEDTEIVVSLASGDQAHEYHSQVQKLALFFIENADCVDLTSNEGGGEWNVLYCFRKHKNIPSSKENQNETVGYSLVGYMTLFGFYAPFHKPKGGIVLRICQALVLPPYQRQGHGKQMMRYVYDYAHGRYDNTLKSVRLKNNDTSKQMVAREIVEINVEDPAPGFTRMRDAIDFERLQGLMTDHEKVKSILKPYCDSDFILLPDADAKTVASIAKITVGQIQIAYEIYKLRQLKERTSQLCKDKDAEQVEELKKKYRLMVKKRLNQLNKEDIGSYGTKEEKKARLGGLFEESYNRYEHIVTRSGLN